MHTHLHAPPALPPHPQDICAVAAPPTQPLNKLDGLASGLPPVAAARRSTAAELLQEKYRVTAIQESENDKAEIVIVCEPEGMSLQMGGLHPRASLYEKPVNLEAAKQVGNRSAAADAALCVCSSVHWLHRPMIRAFTSAAAALPPLLSLLRLSSPQPGPLTPLLPTQHTRPTPSSGA